MIEGESKSAANRFNFHFHVGFDLYVAVRCGKKEAYDELEAADTSDPLACGYLSMSLARSENSAVPKNLSRAKELSKQFVPPILEIVNHCTSTYLADANYLLGFAYQEGIYEKDGSYMMMYVLVYLFVSHLLITIRIFCC